jgi:hypothetical protein
MRITIVMMMVKNRRKLVTMVMMGTDDEYQESHDHMTR